MSRARTLMNFELIPANVGDRHVFNRFQIAYYPPPGPIQTAPTIFPRGSSKRRGFLFARCDRRRLEITQDVLKAREKTIPERTCLRDMTHSRKVVGGVKTDERAFKEVTEHEKLCLTFRRKFFSRK
jgi:hypothetical protein